MDFDKILLMFLGNVGSVLTNGRITFNTALKGSGMDE
jgi:hypothetical protein